MDFKQVHVETLVFDCDTDGKGTYNGNFQRSLHIPIDQPVAVIVRQITYVSREHESMADVKQGETATVVTYPLTQIRAYTISSSFVNNRPLGSFVSGTSVAPNTIIPLGTTVNGDYTFTIRNHTNTYEPTGVLVLTLEFVR